MGGNFPHSWLRCSAKRIPGSLLHSWLVPFCWCYMEFRNIVFRFYYLIVRITVILEVLIYSETNFNNNHSFVYLLCVDRIPTQMCLAQGRLVFYLLSSLKHFQRFGNKHSRIIWNRSTLGIFSKLIADF